MLKNVMKHFTFFGVALILCLIPKNVFAADNCADIIIKRDGYLEQPNKVIKGYNDKFSKEVASNLINYTATKNCNGTVINYYAMCIDPHLEGVTESGRKYNASSSIFTSNPDLFKKYYYLYKQRGTYGDNIIAHVARFLAYDNGLFTNATGRWSSHKTAYEKMNDLRGFIDEKIFTLYNDVNANYNSVGVSAIPEVRVEASGDSLSSGYTVTASIDLSGSIDTRGSRATLTAKDDNGSDVSFSGLRETSLSCDGSRCTASFGRITGRSEACKIKFHVTVLLPNANLPTNVVIASSVQETNTYQKFLLFGDPGSSSVIEGDSDEKDNSGTDELGNRICGRGDYCPTNVKFTCGDSNDTVKIIEGIPSGESEVDWEKCVINNPVNNNNGIDPKRVSFKSDTSYENKYCAFNCKEDWAFRFPGNLGTFQRGRYISINLDGFYHSVVGIAGQKTCVSVARQIGSNTTYISNSNKNLNISIKQFEKDYAEQKNIALAALNAYSFYKAMYDAIEAYKDTYLENTTDGETTSDPSSVNPTGVTCTLPTGTSCSPGAYDPVNSDWVFEYYEAVPDDTIDFDYKRYKLSTTSTDNKEIVKANIVERDTKSSSNGHSYGSYTEEGDIAKHVDTQTSNAGSATGTYPNPTATDATATSSCTNYCTKTRTGLVNGTDEYRLTQLKETLTRIKTLIEGTIIPKFANAVSAMQSYSNQIHDCTDTTTWSSFIKNYEFKYSPEVEFYYDESYIKKAAGTDSTKLKPANCFLDKCKDQYAIATVYCNYTNKSNEGVDIPVKNFSSSDCSTSPGTSINPKIPSSLSFDEIGELNNNASNYYRVNKIINYQKYGDPMVNLSGVSTGDGRFIYYRSDISYSINNGDNKGLAYNYLDSSGKNYVAVDIYDPALKTTVNFNGTRPTPDGHVFPIKITTEPKTYYYQLKFNDIGQKPNGEPGRIFGSGGYVPTDENYVCTFSVSDFGGCDCNDPSCPDYPCPPTCDCNDPTCDSYPCPPDNCDCNDPTCEKYPCPPTCDCNDPTCENYPCGGSSCQSVNIISTNESGYKNIGLIDENGKINFYARTVSLWNLFGTSGDESNKGFNWIGNTSGVENGGTSQKVSKIIKNIQKKGENIYSEEPDFSVTITPSCAAKIREFNRNSEEGDGLGFSDYTLKSMKNHISDDSEFLNNLSTMGCLNIKNNISHSTSSFLKDPTTSDANDIKTMSAYNEFESLIETIGDCSRDVYNYDNVQGKTAVVMKQTSWLDGDTEFDRPRMNGTKYEILGTASSSSDEYWSVKSPLTGVCHWIKSDYMAIDLTQYLAGYNVDFKIHNLSESLYRTSGAEIPGVTGNPLYSSSYLPVATYSFAKKLKTAATKITNDGRRLEIYDAYRPYDVTKYIYEKFGAMIGIYDNGLYCSRSNRYCDALYPLGPTWFLARKVSKHNVACAVDVSLTGPGIGNMPTIMANGVELSMLASGSNESSLILRNYMMTVAGLNDLNSEWWHFQDNDCYNRMKPADENYPTPIELQGIRWGSQVSLP